MRYWRFKGVGPPGYKVGKRVLYPERDLNAWLCEQQQLDVDRRS